MTFSIHEVHTHCTAKECTSSSGTLTLGRSGVASAQDGALTRRARGASPVYPVRLRRRHSQPHRQQREQLPGQSASLIAQQIPIYAVRPKTLSRGLFCLVSNETTEDSSARHLPRAPHVLGGSCEGCCFLLVTPSPSLAPDPSSGAGETQKSALWPGARFAGSSLWLFPDPWFPARAEPEELLRAAGCRAWAFPPGPFPCNRLSV